MVPDRQLTTYDVQIIFGCSHMTVYNWMREKTNKPALPHERRTRGTLSGIVFKLSEVLQWAQDNGVKLASGDSVTEANRTIIQRLIAEDPDRVLFLWHTILAVLRYLKTQERAGTPAQAA